MRREAVEQTLCGLLIFLSLGTTLFFMFSVLASCGSRSEPCQILDIQLETRQGTLATGSVCRVVIRTNESVPYRVTYAGENASVLVELAKADIAPEAIRNPLSNDLIRDIWVRPGESGSVTVGLDLALPGVQVTDHASPEPDSGIVIDLTLPQRPIPCASPGTAENLLFV